jgi:hypothetical protein
MKTPQPLIVALPFHQGDFALAKQLIQWIVTLQSAQPRPASHSLLLVADSALKQSDVSELAISAKPAFDSVRVMIVPVPPSTETQRVWPPNVMFLSAARQIKTNYKLPFLWLEPDCVPLTPLWLDSISIEYAFCPKRFMGPIIHQEGQPGLPADHLTGCSVYPNDAYDVINAVESVRNGVDAWDIGSAAVVVPKAANTLQIHHFWGSKDMPPIFVRAKKPEDPQNFVTIDFIRKGAVLFHRSKDGGLLKLLMASAMEPTPEPNLPPLTPQVDLTAKPEKQKTQPIPARIKTP